MTAKKILLVDDDEDDRMIFGDAVREINENLIYKEANNGLEALLHLQNRPSLPDMIFLDLNMPKMNGYECLSAIKKENKFRHIPVIIFTTSKFEAERIHSMNIDSTFFLLKPGEYALFKAELKKILNKISA